MVGTWWLIMGSWLVLGVVALAGVSLNQKRQQA